MHSRPRATRNEENTAPSGGGRPKDRRLLPEQRQRTAPERRSLAATQQGTSNQGSIDAEDRQASRREEAASRGRHRGTVKSSGVEEKGGEKAGEEANQSGTARMRKLSAEGAADKVALVSRCAKGTTRKMGTGKEHSVIPAAMGQVGGKPQKCPPARRQPQEGNVGTGRTGTVARINGARKTRKHQKANTAQARQERRGTGG